jgi:serine/threonine-protein kinase
MTEPIKPTQQLREGDVVAGRFKLTGTVGKGAMGAVYAAEHTQTGQKVALKFMIVEDAEGEEFVTRFQQEARVMA